MKVLLEAQLTGLDWLIRSHEIDEQGLEYLFTHDRIVAADWSGRISQGEWVRILYSDGELDFDAPPQVVFNAFTRFSRYADWTRSIHVGCEWLDVRAGGVGFRFLLWEKPGGRQVMHYAAVTDMERNRKFTWRAPMAEWGKAFFGTSMQIYAYLEKLSRQYTDPTFWQERNEDRAALTSLLSLLRFLVAQFGQVSRESNWQDAG